MVARTSDVKIYIERNWRLRVGVLGGQKLEKDSHVFSHPDGRPIHYFEK